MLLKLLTFFGVILEVPADGSNRKVPHKKAIGDHEGKDNKTQRIEPLHDQAYWNNDEQDHQIVEESTGRLVFPPPVVGFDSADVHSILTVAAVYL